MDIQNPVYTEKSRCQDCYKCVRHCPVKAIIIEDGSARIDPDLCILCGTCIRICPRGAKTIRNDVPSAKKVLSRKKRVYAAVAPSWRSEFSGYSSSVFAEAVMRLGFSGISETALGAEVLSGEIRELLTTTDEKLVISPACPSVIEYLKKYLPEYGKYIADLHSPVLAQSLLLKKNYGDEAGIVFIGPCPAKKREADLYPEYLDIALTFYEFRRWLAEEGISFDKIAVDRVNLPEPDFLPSHAGIGVLYPVDGGMTASIRSECPVNDISFMNFSGIDTIIKALHDFDCTIPGNPLFLELLACDGGCINGPGCISNRGTIEKRRTILSHIDGSGNSSTDTPSLRIDVRRNVPVVRTPDYSEDEIRIAMEELGKYTSQDELNCGGCGYDSCRNFAAAFLQGKAEKSMCVSHMRKTAQQETNQLLRSIPEAAVLVDSSLKVIDCNLRFLDFLDAPYNEAFADTEDLTGASLDKVVSFAGVFEEVLKNNICMADRDVKAGDSLLSITVFPIVTHEIAGAIIQDITEPAVQVERITSRAREVIRKNLSTARQIAELLGENAADTEAILDSLVKTLNKPS